MNKLDHSLYNTRARTRVSARAATFRHIHRQKRHTQHSFQFILCTLRNQTKSISSQKFRQLLIICVFGCNRAQSIQ